MADALKEWLRTRLSAIMDLTPEIFARYTSDGTLLAQILHSYDIITNNQLSTILRTRDPALSRVNLRTLRIWLKLINVTLSDECIEEISKGKGASSLQLFYKVHLSLEGKDRLHFIALQKERKHASSRFNVSTVSEDSTPLLAPEHCLSAPLIDAADTILWHRNKFWVITEACRRERERFEALMEYPVIQPIEHFIPEELPDREKIEREKLDEFASKHPVRKTKKKYYMVKCCPSKRFLDVSREDPATAAEYTDFLKKRSKKAAKDHELKLKTQTTMMAEAWEQLLRKQDRSFDETLGKQVLNQSRYEKRMLRKLCEVRDMRNTVVANRRIVDAMLLKAKENEQRLKQERRQETIKNEEEDIEMEICRINELHQRIRDEKVRRVKEKHQDICSEIVNDFIDIAIKIADCHRMSNVDFSNIVWNECRTLFLKGQPQYEFMDYFNYIEEEENAEESTKANKSDETIIKSVLTNSKIRVTNKEEEINIKEESKTEEKRKLFQAELERQQFLADADLKSYLDLTAPWDQFVSKRDEEEMKTEEVYRLGCVVLGYIVHRLLEILYPYPAKAISCSVPRVKMAAIISGITSASLHEQLRELLEDTGIRLLTMEDAINHCLRRYKREMSDVRYIDLNITSATTRDLEKLETRNKDNSKKHERKKIEKSPMSHQNNVTEEKETQTPRKIPHDDMDPILSDAAYIGKWTHEFLTLGQPISNELNTKILIEYLKEIGCVEGWVLINYPNTYEQMAMLEKTLTGYEIPSDPVNLTDINIEDVEDIDLPSPRIVFEGDDIDTFAIYRQSRLLPNPISKKDYDTLASTFMTIYIKIMLKPKTLNNQEQSCVPLSDDATSVDKYYANQNIAYGFFYNVLDPAALKQLVHFIINYHEKKSVLDLSGKIQDEEKSLDTSKVIVKRLISEFQKYEEKTDAEAESRESQQELQTRLINDYVRPGEDNWQWLELSQPPALLEMLATFWESVEQAYIETLKEIFLLKKMHSSAIIPYKNFILNNLMKFVDRLDKRQILLQDFHRAFNEIDEDLRDDPNMKCELHCRVDDFRTKLWELCDVRRHEAEEERKRTVRTQWTLMEAGVLINVYIGLLQAESDRFIDTIQLLQDYYTSMLQKPLRESQFFKIVLEDIELEDILQETLPKDKEQMEISSQVVNKNQLKIDIETLLIDVSKNFDADENVVYNIIKNNIRLVKDIVNSTSSTMWEMLRKEEKSVIPKIVKGKEKISDSTFDEPAKRNHDLMEEWWYAVSFEINRINERLDVLSAAARLNVALLLDTMRQCFHQVHDYIVEKYKREIESINEMANVFCFAIEEKRPIQQELILDGDQFIVRSNVLMFPEERERPTRKAPSPLRFRMAQLERLTDIFQRIAPRGIVSDQVLVYILQDLVTCGEEDCYPPFVPCAWRQLRPPDIEILIERLFGAAEYIEWREFVLYAMDLPTPSHEDILKARAAFRKHDPELKETVTRGQFYSTPLWFLEISDENLLDEKLDYNYSDTKHEERLGDVSNLGSDFIERSDDDSGATLRLMLAKKLLCRMYLVNRDLVHYTNMLLAFCKDENPNEGLGKAFTLAMGARVCTDEVEGERYVKELVEQKRRVKELKLNQDHIREESNEIVPEILNYTINETAETILEKSHDRDLNQKHQIIIQQLNGSDETDPSKLLPSEEVAKDSFVESPSAISKEYEYDQSFVSTENGKLEDHDGIQPDEKVIFWLPRDACLSVLSICLPWLESQTHLFQTSSSLREEITRVYDDLRDEELTDERDLVLSHRLINHSFIRELLCASNKFAAKNMTELLRNILKDEDGEAT